ncbi:MAG: hypothetical protein GEU75_09895 [Dehalococcoidia bacterium]|nr:hypothetical protein [Dehalococcoidia bacterium]
MGISHRLKRDEVEGRLDLTPEALSGERGLDLDPDRGRQPVRVSADRGGEPLVGKQAWVDAACELL